MKILSIQTKCTEFIGGQRTYTDILKMSKNELNPPVYLWVLHTWYKINGNYTNEVHARYLSLIFSVLTIIVIFLFGKSYFNYTTGVIASLIFSFNPVQVIYAHNISAYAMITFLFVFSLYITHLFFVFFDNKKIRWLLFALLMLTDTLLIYTHYMIVWGLLAQLIMALFEAIRQKKAFFYYLGTQILSVILFLPWLPYMIANAKADNWMEKPTIVDAQVRQIMPVIAEEVKEPGTLLVINADYMKYLFAYYFNQYNTYIGEQE